jgi:hypothetical protein
MGRPIQYPRQVVVHVSGELADRIKADAAQRGDGSQSAAHRRLLQLGVLLADAVALADNPFSAANLGPSEYRGISRLYEAAKAVR